MPDDEIRTPDYDPENPRCDQEQLKFLKDCIDEGAEGIKKWNQWHEIQGYMHEENKVWLQKAELPGVYLKEINLHRVHLEGADGSHHPLDGIDGFLRFFIQVFILYQAAQASLALVDFFQRCLENGDGFLQFVKELP